MREHKVFEHVMLDIETLGQGPRAPVVQIGLAMFDPKTGEIGLTREVRVMPDFEAFEPDPSTVLWWMRQSKQAQHAVFGGAGVDYREAADLVESFFRLPFLTTGEDGAPPVKLWAKPPSFDVVIVENMMRAAGKTRMPWKYHAPRCLRTLMELAGVDRSEAVKSELNHSALSDAIAQAKTAAMCWGRLGLDGEGA